MPSVMASPRRSFGGASMIGSAPGDPTTIFGFSTAALPVPSGLSSVRCTLVTLRGSASSPGSGSSTNANAAIIAG